MPVHIRYFRYTLTRGEPARDGAETDKHIERQSPFSIFNSCFVPATSVRLQPRTASVERWIARGKTKLPSWTPTQHWTARHQHGENPAVYACLANGGTRGVMRTANRPSPDVCPHSK